MAGLEVRKIDLGYYLKKKKGKKDEIESKNSEGISNKEEIK